MLGYYRLWWLFFFMESSFFWNFLDWIVLMFLKRLNQTIAFYYLPYIYQDVSLKDCAKVAVRQIHMWKYNKYNKIYKNPQLDSY